MSQNITDVSAFTDPLTEAADGDQVSGAVRLTHMQKVANRTRWLADNVPGLGADARVVIPVIPGYPVPTVRHAVGYINSALCMLQTDVTDAGAVIYTLQFPCAQPSSAVSAITGVRFDFYVGSGRGSLPATLPKLTLYRQIATAAAAPEALESRQMTAANLAAYEVGAVSLTFIMSGDRTISSDYNYFLNWEGETGGGAAVNKLGLMRLIVTLGIA